MRHHVALRDLSKTVEFLFLPTILTNIHHTSVKILTLRYRLLFTMDRGRAVSTHLSWQKQLIFFHQLIQISFINSFNSFILASPTHSTHSKNELVVDNSF